MVYRIRVITAAGFLSLGLMGMTMAFLGGSLPELRSFLDLDIEKAGLLTVFYQIGYSVNSFIGGLLSDVMRRERVIMAGCFFLGCGELFFALSDGVAMSFFLVMVMGVGSGLILTGSNALLVGLYANRKASIMNIHHVFFGVGSFIGPLIMAQLLKSSGAWPYGYHGLGVAVILLIFLFLAGGKTPAPTGSRPALTKHLGALVRNRDFIHLVIINTSAVGTQFGLMFLSVTYLHEGKGLSIVDAGYVLSLFFMGLIIGRMICSWLTIRRHATHVVLVLLIMLTLSVTAAVIFGGKLAAVGVIASGLACSGVFPSLLGLGGILFHEAAGTAMGIMSTMNGVGGAIICWLMVLVSKKVDVRAGFVVLIASSLCSLIFHCYNMRIFSRAEHRLVKR